MWFTERDFRNNEEQRSYGKPQKIYERCQKRESHDIFFYSRTQEEV